jgi:hypothetical protein
MNEETMNEERGKRVKIRDTRKKSNSLVGNRKRKSARIDDYSWVSRTCKQMGLLIR